MKNLLILLVLVAMGISARAQNDSADCVSALTQMEALSKNNDAAALSKMITYSKGPDAYKMAIDLTAHPENKKRVQNVIEELKEVGENGFTVTGFETQSESEGTWLILEVEYPDGKHKDRMRFAFLRINNQILLGDWDD